MAGQLASIKIPGIFFSAPSIWGLCPIRTPIYTRVDELNVSNHGRRYELSLSSSSHFLAFVLSKKNSTPPITAQFFIIEQNQRYSNDTRAECYTSFERWNGYRHRSNKFFFFLSFFHPARERIRTNGFANRSS